MHNVLVEAMVSAPACEAVARRNGGVCGSKLASSSVGNQTEMEARFAHAIVRDPRSMAVVQ